ncbi:MAG: tRNA lysidine(34) synthetase TilS [Castellaniella sp.]|uniref:tRNA lysidine(34) synthetase TilS n=1 Tax=Castellaniella sp. TaxID=1955812 RepID=UPI003A924FAB
MAASRKPAKPAWALDPHLTAALQKAVQALPDAAPLGVALSGGADSAMLAVHAAQVAAVSGRALHCFHIHHGLQPAADEWLAQAHRLAGILGVACHSRRIQVSVQGTGMEAAAREARYVGLAALAQAVGVDILFLAHHQDDQAETVLLRLLRGAGPEALAAMSAQIHHHGILWCRPWLSQPRSRILQAAGQFAAITGWHPVQDPSNHDTQYKRAALRHDLAPVLDKHWPAWRTSLARHAGQAADLGLWMASNASDDWQGLDPSADGRSFSLLAWRQLPAVRQAALVRYWLQCQGLRMPTEARLADWLRQFRQVHALGHDRRVSLPHEGYLVQVRRGRVVLSETSAKPS